MANSHNIPLFHFRYSDNKAIPFEIARIEQLPARARSAKPARISFYIIIEAKRLLAYTDQTVAQICGQLQFNDPPYFSRFFKRETGQSPLAFRKNILEKYQNA